MFKNKNIKISELALNTGQVPGLPKNPRFIRDNRFKDLVKSIQDAPEMLDYRKLLVYPFNGKGSNFSTRIIYEDEVCPTMTTGVNALFEEPVYMNADEVRDVSSFPQDYDFTGKSADFLCGMSVPPVMTAQIAHQIYLQWLKCLE